MEELFKALQTLPKIKAKKYFMKKEGSKITWIGQEQQSNSIEIDLQTFLRLQRGGITNFVCDENNTISSKVFNGKIKHPTLVEDTEGVSFVDDNPYWIAEDNKNTRKFSWKAE